MTSDENIEERVKAGLALQLHCLETLCTIAHELTKGLPIALNSHFEFMGACFLAKQVEHAGAVHRLHLLPDAGTVARTMLEGLWQLKWAALDVHSRGKQWRGFCYVHDWRVMKEIESRGGPVSEEERTAIMLGIKEYGEFYHRPSAKKALANARRLPDDPYTDTWHGMTVRELATGCGDTATYVSKYKYLCNRVHWSVSGIGEGLQNRSGILRYDSTSLFTSILATLLAFNCVADTGILLDSKLKRKRRRIDIDNVTANFLKVGTEHGLYK